MKDISAFMEDVKEYLSSDDMAKMLNELYGADCTSEKLHSIIEETLNVKSGSLQYKRSIVADTAHEETISLGIDDNVFDVRITNKSANDAFEGSLIVSDKKKTVDFSLILAKNDEGEIVTLRNGSIFTEVMAKDKSSITYLHKNGSYEMKMTFSTLPDAKFGENIYDATASSQKNRMLCELSPWLTSNGNAALLFKTYEVGLKPISFNLEDVKINFDGRNTGRDRSGQRHPERDLRYCTDHFDDTLHDNIEHAAEITGKGTDQDAQEEADDRAGKRQRQGHLTAVQNPGEQVTSQRVRAEQHHLCARAAIAALSCAEQMQVSLEQA